MGDTNFDSVDAAAIKKGGVAITPTAAQLNQMAAAFGTVNADRTPKVAIKPLVGATIHAGVVAWQNPEAGSIIIKRSFVDVTTVATGACKLDIGTTPTNATTASDNLLDGIDVNAATGLLEAGDGDAPGAGNGKNSQKLATGKWVTIKEISGNATGLAGNLYIEYVNA